jgi:hypothetical protein
MDCDNSTAINYRSACLGNDLAPVGRRPMDLQGTFGLVIPAFAETAALAVFLFVPFAAVRRSLMAHRCVRCIAATTVAIGSTADKGRHWRGIARPRMTHKRTFDGQCILEPDQAQAPRNATILLFTDLLCRPPDMLVDFPPAKVHLSYNSTLK